MAALCGGAACPTQLAVSEEVTHSLCGLAGQVGRAPPCTTGHAPSDTGESGVCATLFPARNLPRLRPAVALAHLSGLLPPPPRVLCAHSA